VKRERLEFLADKRLYARRLAFYVGRRCPSSTIKDIAVELRLDTVMELDKQYMREQLRRIGTPRRKILGIDELSLHRLSGGGRRSSRVSVQPWPYVQPARER
jgi:transposase